MYHLMTWWNRSWNLCRIVSSQPPSRIVCGPSRKKFAHSWIIHSEP